MTIVDRCGETRTLLALIFTALGALTTGAAPGEVNNAALLYYQAFIRCPGYDEFPRRWFAISSGVSYRRRMYSGMLRRTERSSNSWRPDHGYSDVIGASRPCRPVASRAMYSDI